jgi:hypothetical protein
VLDLKSPAWATISASPGGNGVLTARLLGQLWDGDESAWAELYQQVCHQNTVGEVAFVAAPHLVGIARNAKPRFRAILLGTIGSIVASGQCYGRGAAKLREEWKADFALACANARSLAAETLREPDLDPADSFELIATLAALHGHANLALLLQDGPRLSCPECGAPIVFADAEE